MGGVIFLPHRKGIHILINFLPERYIEEDLMQLSTQAVPASQKMVWAGRIISALTILFLLFDSIIKMLELAPAVEATTQLGYAETLVFGIGIIELASLVLYMIPQTSVLGAILLTGHLGGAVATQMRAGSDLFSVVFPIIIGLLLWGGLFTRDNRLRSLIPLRQ